MEPRRGIRPLISLHRTLWDLREAEVKSLTRRIRILGSFLFIALLLMFVPSIIAWAAPATQAASQPASQPAAVAANVQQWWMPLLAPILTAIGTIIAAFVAALLKKLINIFESKYNIEVPAAIEQLVGDKAKQLIAAAEEEAERRILHEDGQPTSGAEKSKQVVTALLKYVDQLGYGKQYQEEQIQKLVDGILHLNRAGSDSVIGSDGARAKLLLQHNNPAASKR
jgi:hypothetical protein